MVVNLPEIIKRGVSFMVMLGGKKLANGEDAALVLAKKYSIPSPNIDREVSATATIQTVTWFKAENVRKVNIIPLTPNGTLVVTFNSPDAIGITNTASSWLNDIGDSSSSPKRWIVDRSIPESQEFEFTHPLVRIDILDYNSIIPVTKTYIRAEK